jgi:methionine synthase I (cobalamin-dependent)
MTATARPKSQSKPREFREQLRSRALVADGALGTLFHDRGVSINRSFDELNLSMPHLVREAHQGYVNAGADIIETNTFGANRARLGSYGLAGKLEAINQAGVRLAREAAQDAAFVAGAMGPLGVRLEPSGTISFSEARAIFREQADALVGAGVDLLILETFYDLPEIREAIFAARQAAGDEMAIVAQVTIDNSGNMPGGGTPETYTAKLDEWPADVIGLNCSPGPKVTFETIERMLEYSSKPMSAMPSAGLPTVVDGHKIYLCSPEDMAQDARRLLRAGVRIVGGCCGTTAEHIRLIRAEAGVGRYAMALEVADAIGARE